MATVYNYDNGLYTRIIVDVKLWDEVRNATVKYGAGNVKSNAITVYLNNVYDIKANGKSRITKTDTDYDTTAEEFFINSLVISKVDMKDFGGIKHTVIGID